VSKRKALTLNSFYASVSKTSVKLISSESGKVLETLEIGPAKDEHRNFIISTWIRSYESELRKAHCYAGAQDFRLDRGSYSAGEGGVAERCWKESQVVTSPTDGYTVHGWICTEGGHVYHIYIPPSLRGIGLGRGLLEAFAGTAYTTHKPISRAPKGHTVRWNPWAICGRG
jgi:hypothetical protein